MRNEILRNGFIVLRNVLDRELLQSFRTAHIEPAVAAWKAMEITQEICDATNAFYGAPWGIEMYNHTAHCGYVTDRMLRFKTGHSYYELLPPALMARLAAFGELKPSVVAHCRAIHPKKMTVHEGGTWAEPVPFHYDYLYHRETLLALNLWVPFDPVGRDAPTLRLVKAPVRTMMRFYEDLRAPAEVEKHFSDFAVLELEPGDVAVFTNWTLHQTHIEPSMTVGRLSAEIRFCARDHVFHETRYGWWERIMARRPKCS